MKNAKQKIIAGTVFSVCAAAVIVGGSIITEKAEAVPASIMGVSEETPVIVLDAGHGEST